MLGGVSRRGFALGAGSLFFGCQHRSEASPVGPVASSALADAAGEAGPRGSVRLLEWSFEAVSTRTVVLVPTWGGPGERFPVLVALHGRGEARKSPAEGVLGWPRDYALVRAIARVCAPPLESADFEGFVDATRLELLNRGLATHPFGGLVVACPYVPDLDLADEDAMRAFGAFVTSTLLPRVRSETPALADAASTGVDGVSLGGAVALSVGLDSPTSFGAIGTLQPAIDIKDAARWTSRAKAARQANPRLALRLLTSDGDYFRDAVRGTSAAWTAAGVTHELEQVRGPHDYPFNRGPGSIEMLLWHDRELRRRP